MVTILKVFKPNIVKMEGTCIRNFVTMWTNQSWELHALLFENIEVVLLRPWIYPKNDTYFNQLKFHNNIEYIFGFILAEL